MDVFLLLLALTAQSADAALTCRGLARGGVETNPIYGQSCARVIAVKAVTMTAVSLPFLPQRARRVGWAAHVAGGTLGVTLTLRLGPKD